MKQSDTTFNFNVVSTFFVRKCENCAYFSRKGNSNVGKCNNDKSANYKRDTFKDIVCEYWRALFSSHNSNEC